MLTPFLLVTVQRQAEYIVLHQLNLFVLRPEPQTLTDGVSTSQQAAAQAVHKTALESPTLTTCDPLYISVQDA